MERKQQHSQLHKPGKPSIGPDARLNGMDDNGAHNIIHMCGMRGEHLAKVLK